MAGRMRFCRQASIALLILVVLVLKCFLGEKDGQGMTSKDSALDQADPLRRLLQDSSFQIFPPASVTEVAASNVSTEPCDHQRDVTELEKQLGKLRKHVIQGDSAEVESLLNKWSPKETYVHNLNDSSTNQSYSQIQCSDLDFLARHRVRIEESVYDGTYQEALANVSYVTILELALHMTRSANERALTLAMSQRNEMRVGNEGERFEERINIIRLLLEKGFLWGSSDLVCKVVPKQNGYRKTVREAFAWTILHDLVRDPVHLNKTRIKFLRETCGGNGMDGVVWILGSAPGAFSLPSVLSQKTVLMKAAQDDSNHDEAFINFPELIRLHKVLHASLTTVDLHGWNAEMYAARALKAEHVSLLKDTILEIWRRQARDAFDILFLGDPASDWLSNACIFLALKISFLAYIGFAIFVCIGLFDVALLVCKTLCNSKGLNRLLSWLEVFAQCRWTFRGSEMLFRVLWLLTLNIAFLGIPPEVAIAWEKRVSPFEIPSVSKWNPLPATVESILCFSVILFFIFAVPDYRYARRKAADDDEHPAPAVPDDRYQDPNCHFIGCVCVFGLMSLLMVIYLQIVLRPLALNPKRIALWFGSLLVQTKITLEETLSPKAQLDLQNAFGAASSEGYDPFDKAVGEEITEKNDSRTEERYRAVRNAMHHWHRWACCMVTPFNPKIWHLLMVARQKKVPVGKEDGPAEIQWSWPEIIARFVMSYMSNGLYKALIVYTLPLWLCRGGLTDFVLNAFATVYIVELDDLTGRDEWKLLSEEELTNFRSRGRLPSSPSDSTEQSA